MTFSTVPDVFYEIAFNADPNQNTVPPWWTDVSNRSQFPWTASQSGRQYELDTNETGEYRPTLSNWDGALDPSNLASPFAPNVKLYRGCRARMTLGANLLTPDQASSGEWTPLPPGTPPVTAGFLSPYQPTIVQTAGAYQGTQVVAVAAPAVPSGSVALVGAWVPQVTAGLPYTFTAQVQGLTVGQNPTASVALTWFNAAGTVVSAVVSSGTAVTGGAGSWTAVTVTGTAPGAAVKAQVAVEISGTSAPSTLWVDGMQLEQRAFASRWQMPWSPGVNRFPQAIANCSSASTWAPDSGTVAVYQNLLAAPTGATNAVGWTTPAGTTSSPNLWWGQEPGNPSQALSHPSQDNVQVVAGQTYTASFYALRAASADATLTVTAQITWFAASGAYMGTSASTAVTLSTSAWGQVTIAGAVVPAGVAWGRVLMWISAPSSTTAQNTIYVTGCQFEQASAATTWADPGLTRMLFTGGMERWPQTWTEQNGTYGTSVPIGVDALSGLAQPILLQPFVNEVLALKPNFFYQLNEPSGSTACVDTTGNRVIPAPVENAPTGAGSLAFGSSVTSTNPGSAFIGTPGPVATFNNDDALISPTLRETFISLHKTTVAPGPPSSGAWTRIICFRTSIVPDINHQARMWWSGPNQGLGLNARLDIGIANNSTGQAYATFVDSAGASIGGITSGGACDGNWHMIAIGVDPSSGNATFWFDGVSTTTATGVHSPSGLTSDTIGCTSALNYQSYDTGWIGDLAFAAELPLLLSNAQALNLYNSWRSASTGDSSDARYKRILSWVGYTGPTAIDTGVTRSMGPATDTVGATSLDALNAVALTENGDSYASPAGVMTFKARSARYNVRTPAFTFGEGLPVGSGAEWPCEVVGFDYDPSHLANIIQVTQYSTGLMVQAQDAASKSAYYSRTYQRTINVQSITEAVDASNYLLGRMKDPHMRLAALRLHPSAMPGLFAVCAQLEKGVRIRVIRRPNGAPSITVDCFVEKVDWAWNPDTGDVWVDVQASPADLANYWVVSALHTTLNAQATSGQAHATINALPDAAVNKLAQSLPSGYSLTFEPGTARAETIAIAPGGIPSTSLGYSTATLTMASNLAFTHPAGSVVCEPLPAGYTDPTTWDASSVLGAAYVPILSGGAAGSNNVTVGPLPDSKVNGIQQTWNAGDVVWLTSGPGLGLRSEAATILSVTPTLPGYTSATITFTANLGFNHLVGEYVSDPLANNGINPAALTPSTRVAYSHTWPLLLPLLGVLHLPVRAAALAVLLLTLVSAVLSVRMVARAARTRGRGIGASGLQRIESDSVAFRAPGLTRGVPTSELLVGVSLRAGGSFRVSLRELPPHVLRVRHGLTVRRIAAPAVVAHDVVERQSLRDRCDLVLVQQSVHVPDALAVPDLGSSTGCVTAPPAPAGTVLVDVRVDFNERLHVSKSSDGCELMFEDCDI